MAVYTKVSKVGIQSILSKYNVGKLIKYEEIQEGIENSNFKVTTTDGIFILTIYEKRKKDCRTTENTRTQKKLEAKQCSLMNRIRMQKNSTKKIIAQGGGYKYKKNRKKIEGFGFSCNVDYIAELIK